MRLGLAVGLAFAVTATSAVAPTPGQLVAPTGFLTVRELDARVITLIEQVDAVTAALSAGDTTRANSEFGRLATGWDQINDEAILLLYPQRYGVMDGVVAGLQASFLYNRPQGTGPALEVLRQQLVEVEEDLAARLANEGADAILPVPALPTALTTY
jgi:hypothetical protein